ncbi:MAG: T9SS type A sorting domain-containing protein [Candidatus Neomarinimicrobiota bacterium]|nr:T9SS type A sorting domain-containing protein [Candidatus Neomarinimicrobiota bacterium]
MAQRPVPKRMKGEAQSAEFRMPREGKHIRIGTGGSTASPRTYRETPNSTVILVDSSSNGYGLISGFTTPLSYNPEEGFIMAYRQLLPDDPEKSGYIGAAFSEDGELFTSYSELNIIEPAEKMGRYPSAVAGSDYPYIVWNEYTQPQGEGTGGGLYGGRPVYSWDEFYFGGGSFFSPPLDINNGCSPLPCDPPDNWVGSVSLTHDGTTPVLNAAYSQWSNSQQESSSNRWLYHSINNMSGYFTFDDPILLFDEADFISGGNTSNVVVDMNESGIGYVAVSSYFKGQSPDSSHTFMIRKTNDYGESWSGEGGTGMNGTDYYFIPESVLKDRFFNDGLMVNGYTDSSGETVLFERPFITYSVELLTSFSGGIHLFATVIPATSGYVYPGIDESCGIYHFYSDDPSDAMSWKVNFVTSNQVSFFYDENWRRLYPSAAVSKDNPDILYVSYMGVADTSSASFNYDIFVRRSLDGGDSWESPVNVTQTAGFGEDEVYPQLASVATDDEAYLIFESPDYNIQTVTPSEGLPLQPDFMNRVYFAKAKFKPLETETPSIVPAQFALEPNYPNPFNPATVITFTLPKTFEVELKIYDLLGEEMAVLSSGRYDAGRHNVTWEAGAFPAGIYLAHLQADGIAQTRKMILLK